MRIFLTGATGFIGSALIPELVSAGHQVLGMTRSEAGAQKLAAAGVEAHRGTLDDLDSLRAGAESVDGVIHLAFDHDNLADFVGICEKDRRVIEALGSVLAGSHRPLLITSGVGMGSSHPGQPATEDVFNPEHPNPRSATELAGARVLETSVNVSVMRLPQVHDTVKQGLITYTVALAREKGVAAYVGDGLNRWSAAPVGDVARLYRLAFERAQPGARYHAVAEEGVAARDIAEVVGRGLGVPVVSLTPDEVPGYFGWLAAFADLDMSASSAWTRKTLGWTPTGPGLLEDLRNMRYDVTPR